MRLLFLICATALLLTGTATAANVQATAALRSGGLTLQVPQLAAQAGQTVQVPLMVADARGSGDGWTLRLGGGPGVVVTDITARCSTRSTCTLPRMTAGGLLRAARDSGMGEIQLVVTVAPLRAGAASVPLAFTLS